MRGRLLLGGLLLCLLALSLLVVSCGDATRTAPRAGVKAGRESVVSKSPNAGVAPKSPGAGAEPSVSGETWSSLAWSPDGKTIAYIVSKGTAVGAHRGMAEASIWFGSISEAKWRPRRLCRITARRGVAGLPMSLFFTSPRKICWATTDEHGALRIFCSDIGTFKPRQSAHVGLVLEQSRARRGTYGPDDVYYSGYKGLVVFTGRVSDGGFGSSSLLIASSYSLWDGSLDMTPLPKSAIHSPTACLYQRVKQQYGGQVDPSLGPSKSYAMYDIAYETKGGGAVLNFTRWSMSPGCLLPLRRADYCFPRPSPDGKRLALLRSVPSSKRAGVVTQQLFIYDVAARHETALTSLPFPYSGSQALAPGCPFCWSPKGDRIAYAYGASIKFVKVPAPPGGRTLPIDPPPSVNPVDLLNHQRSL